MKAKKLDFVFLLYNLCACICMMYLLLLLIVGVHAEWPPSSCSRDAIVKDNTVQLTSTTTSQSGCRVTQLYEEQVYIGISRSYDDKKHNYRRVFDSRIVFTVSDEADTALFDVEVHSDKVQAVMKNGDAAASSPNRCFGIFFNPKPWDVKLEVRAFYDLQKTVVGVSTSKHGSGFKTCFRFELNQIVDKFKIGMDAVSESGMNQVVHGIRTKAPKDTRAAMTESRLVALETTLQQLSTKVQTLQDSLAQTANNHEQHVEQMDSKHQEMRRDLKSSQSRTKLSIQQYSYMSWAFIVFLCIFVFAGIKYMQYYIHKRDKLF